MKRYTHFNKVGKLVFFLVLTLVFSSCSGQTPPINPSPVFVLFTPTIMPEAIATSIPTSTPSKTVETLIGDSVPRMLREQVQTLNLPNTAGLTLDISVNSNSESTLNAIQIQWVYVLAAPFPTVRDGVTFDELRSAWNGNATPNLFNGQPLLMDESTLAAFTALWGAPASGSVRSVGASRSQLLDTAWSDSTWAIIPFESLTPRWKVLTIDGQSPIRKGFDVTKYPLIVPFTLQTSGMVDLASLNFLSSNYDSSKLTTVILTGVTALVRATAFKMEQKGITYPGEKIRDLLRDADITHISNEIPFLTGCPYPNPNSARLVFCSDSKYMGLLTDVGVDVVELTGNHFADYGKAAMEETLSIYKSDNVPYFGGGADLQDSFQPALFEINGNKIAFLGCNRPDIDGPKVAAEGHSGAAPCDFDYFTAKILELKAQGYLVIFTFQWYEDYAPPPNPDQVKDFHRVAEAGATIVSGSQAHLAKAMEFYNDSFIHYGLGNLFFDQMGNFDWMPDGIRREFLDRYVIYDGRLVSVELITAMLEDFSQPRLMTDSERAEFLQEYFIDSGWLTEDGRAMPASGTSVP
jgi:poly-gamma-glutamate synthesis protein (capsule biosynthesis protein)